MSTPEHSTIPEDVRENYRQILADTGQSWEQLADQFDRDADALPDVHGAPYRRLAAWARDEHAAHEPPAPEAPVKPAAKRTTAETRPTRTT